MESDLATEIPSVPPHSQLMVDTAPKHLLFERTQVTRSIMKFKSLHLSGQWLVLNYQGSLRYFFTILPMAYGWTILNLEVVPDPVSLVLSSECKWVFMFHDLCKTMHTDYGNIFPLQV